MRAPVADIGNTAPDVPFADTAPELNPDLDRAALAREFAKRGRIHIPHILTADSARRVFFALEQETPWRILVNEGKEHLELEKFPPSENQALTMAAWNRARTGFQFMYRHHRLSGGGEPYPVPDAYLAKLTAWLTSPELIGFVRDVTGEASLPWASAHATLYVPLDFLNLHDDDIDDADRRIAYVLNMTPNWRPDWGGALQFYDSFDHIEEAYLPSFNALNLFRVPKMHSVGTIAPFGGARYAVSGWFHSSRKGSNASD